MKHSITALALSLLLITPSFAGPFRTATIIGTGASFDYTLTVPAGKAVTITNFLMFNQAGNPSEVASITLINDNPVVGNSAIRILYSASPDATAAQKDVTIDGPAKILVNIPHMGYQAVLTYKIFAN